MSADIYKKIDAIFAQELTQRPSWVDEILGEIAKLNQRLEASEQREVKRDRVFYRFVKEFRRSMYADTYKKRYPKINYKNRTLGVDHQGLLYDVKTSRVLPTKEAFRVYEYLYKKRDFEIFY
jgi:hypothetical protein